MDISLAVGNAAYAANTRNNRIIFLNSLKRIGEEGEGHIYGDANGVLGEHLVRHNVLELTDSSKYRPTNAKTKKFLSTMEISEDGYPQTCLAVA